MCIRGAFSSLLGGKQRGAETLGWIFIFLKDLGSSQIQRVPEFQYCRDGMLL